MMTLTLSCYLHTATLNEILPDPYPQVYEKIKVLPYNAHCWYGHGPIFERLAKEHKIKNILEVGSWLGCSARHFAQLVPENGKVFCVDHWQGSDEHFDSTEVKDWLPTLFQQFLSNIIHARLTHKVVPVRMDSLTAAEKFKKLDIVLDLVYLDGAHDYRAVYKDLRAWYPYVKGKGILCGDDWNIGDVQQAVIRFSKEQKLKIYNEGGFWRLHE